MKKKYLVLLILSFLLVSCRDPQQRPVDEGALETNESSIFRTADVEHCRIVSETTEVRNGLGFDFDVVTTLHRDDVVRVLDQVGDWYVVQLDDNQVGSIDITSAEPIVRDVEADEPSPTEIDDDVVPFQPANEAQDQPNIATQEERPVQERIPQEEVTPRQEEVTPQAQEEVAPQTQEETAPRDRGQLAGDLRAQEERMVQLVNQEREKNGLSPLQIDQEVTRVAGIKSQDMVDHDYFSHYSPTYGSPFEMLDSFGVRYLHAGENLAGNNSVESAHVALMNSSGHRQNILNPDFTHIGIGVRTSPRYGYVYTQLFISKPQ